MEKEHLSHDSSSFSSARPMRIQVLTLLFIGGASSCANLLTCQYVDGDDEPLGQHAFRLHMPQLQCTDDSWPAFWVDLVAYTASFVYGVFIPLLLLHLFSRQHLLMRTCRSVAAVTQVDADGQLRVTRCGFKGMGFVVFFADPLARITARLTFCRFELVQPARYFCSLLQLMASCCSRTGRCRCLGAILIHVDPL